MLTITQSEDLSPSRQLPSRTPSTLFNTVCSTDTAHARQKCSYSKHISPSLMGRVQQFEVLFGQRVSPESKANSSSDCDTSTDIHPTAALLKKEERNILCAHEEVKRRDSDGAGAPKKGVPASQAGGSPRRETVDMKQAAAAGLASSKGAVNSTSTPIRSLTETSSKSQFSKAIGPNLGSRFLKAIKLSLNDAGKFCIKVTAATTAGSVIPALCCLPIAGPAALLIVPITAVVTPLVAFPLGFAGYALGQFGEFVASSIIRYRKM
ncbi:hypothetical protein [Duganella qianjiadongensis]|uniref:DUF697 domain-containing protein n=1 Tax=Duganella qianjiadongensis TaxID=2692176 RepID=A0ABW9VJK6_9BURK|nr:hypothetical protein [Duganella qianjiadongensis]MYM39507.1 hypothetical protein [Duganella qianjiadongensis]